MRALRFSSVGLLLIGSLVACGGGDADVDESGASGGSTSGQGGASAGGAGKGAAGQSGASTGGTSAGGKGGTAGAGGSGAGNGGSAGMAGAGGGTAGKGGAAGAAGSTAGSGGAKAGAAGTSGGAGTGGSKAGAGGATAGAGGAKAGAGGTTAGAGGTSAGAGGATAGAGGATAGAGGAGSGGASAGAGGDAGAGGSAAGAAGTAGAGGSPTGCTPACGVGTVCDDVALTCVPEPPAPHVLFPISGDRVTGSPEIRWEAGAVGATADARIEICDDAACSAVLQTLYGTGTASPTATLGRRAYFLRAFGRTPRGDGTFVEGVTPSITRVFFATGRAAVSRAPIGLAPDLDRNGLADVAVSTATNNPAQITLTLSGASKTTSVTGPTEQPNGYPYGGFAKNLVLASDIDGDGYPEIATIERETGFPEPITVVRYSYDVATKKLVQRQTFDVALPQYQHFVSLTPLGDVDGDGYADLAVVSALPAVAGPSPGSGTVWLQTGVEIQTLFGGPLGWSRTEKTQIVVPPDERTFENTPLPVRGVGDVDGDGIPDLAVGIQVTNTDSCYPARRGRVEIRKGSAAATFDVVHASIEDYFDPASVGDIDGDGLADVGVTREPHGTRAPIPPATTCDGSYTQTGFVPGEVRVLRGAATAPLPESAYTLPVDNVPGCTTGFGFGPNYLVSGVVVGSGDLDGDGLDDVAVVSPDSHPGGASGCSSDSSRVRILPGSASASLSLAQTLAFPEAGFGSLVGRVRIVGDLDTSGASSLVIVGVQKTLVYAGPLGALANTKQLLTPQFPQWPMVGF